MDNIAKLTNEKVHVNQIGYRPDDQKIAIINGFGGQFEVIDQTSGEVVFTGDTYGPIEDAATGDTVCYADFSQLNKSGCYYICVPDFGSSYPFKINQNVYTEIKNAMLKVLYYQRCGIELEEKYAGKWTHVACHLKDGEVFNSKGVMLDGRGGWHDAGDYGKYTVAAAVALAELMLSYEFFPEAFKEEINIPESGNGIPDILNEVRFELEWLFKMQDSATGGAYHKLTTWKFPDMNVMPEDDNEDMYFSPISSTATADFVAVMAMAARVFNSIDAQFAQKCLTASEKAWGWLSANKCVRAFCNPPEIHTGEYRDMDDRDERFWAAAELYRTTGKQEYHEYFRSAYYEYFSLAYKEYFAPECKEQFSPAYHKYFETSYKYKKYDKYGLGWINVGGFGAIAYFFTDKYKVDEVVYEGLKKEFLEVADDFVNAGKIDGYRISLDVNEYWWGSNVNVMNRAIHLIIASMLTSQQQYIQVAHDHVHYLFGRNALDQCYITGFGSKPIKNLHHRPTNADGIDEQIPGMVSGGPNSRLQDKFVLANLQGLPPARCFADEVDSYSTNEMAIYWNTPAVFITAFFDRG